MGQVKMGVGKMGHRFSVCRHCQDFLFAQPFTSQAHVDFRTCFPNGCDCDILHILVSVFPYGATQRGQGEYSNAA